MTAGTIRTPISKIRAIRAPSRGRPRKTLARAGRSTCCRSAPLSCTLRSPARDGQPRRSGRAWNARFLHRATRARRPSLALRARRRGRRALVDPARPRSERTHRARLVVREPARRVRRVRTLAKRRRAQHALRVRRRARRASGRGDPARPLRERRVAAGRIGLLLHAVSPAAITIRACSATRSATRGRTIRSSSATAASPKRRWRRAISANGRWLPCHGCGRLVAQRRISRGCERRAACIRSARRRARCAVRRVPTDDAIYVYTDEDAPRFRVMVADPARPRGARRGAKRFPRAMRNSKV